MWRRLFEIDDLVVERQLVAVAAGQPRIDSEAGLAETAAWYRAQGWL